MSFDKRVEELGLQLPSAPRPAGTYAPVVVVGNMAYVSGQGPLRPDGTLVMGRVGDDLDAEAGEEAARAVGLTMLATLRDQLGSLDKVKRVIKVLGMVNSTPDFQQHPKVINGFSDLMVQVFGDDGRAARSAVGMAALPSNIAVEVEAIFELA